jgi:hypothetical protein
MVRSFFSVALSALLTLPYTTTAYQKGVKLGPNMLDECVACPRMYTNLYQCQKIAQPGRTGDEVRNCVCIPGYDGWYTYIDACRGCLPFTGTDDFLGNYGRMMNTVLSVCRGGGNITSDGTSLCASEAEFEDCMALRDSSEGETWVSFRMFGTDGKYDSNRTMLLNLAAVKANLTTSTTVESTVSTTAAATAATGLDTTASTTTPATGAGSQVTSATTGLQSTTTTAKPSFATRLSQGSQAGYAWGLLVVAGIVGGMI